MAQNCIYNPQRAKFGYSDETYNRLSPYLKKTPTKGEFTNIVRNLGLDDKRMINVTDENGKRFFGDNLKNVEDIDFSKTPIPQNVVVRVPSKSGDQYFVSNKKNPSHPSRWIRDAGSGRLRPNQDWDAIGRNVTGMKRYVRQSDGWWRPAKEGEKGSFLNIQKPASENQPVSKIIDEGFDAIEKDGKFKLIDESQAVNPNRITTKKNVEGAVKNITDDAPTVQQVKEKLVENGVPIRVAGAIAGGITGDMIDSNDEFSGTFWGGALGLMLSSPKVRAKVKSVFPRADGQGDDPIDEMILSQVRQEEYLDKFEQATRWNYKGDFTDDDALDEFLAFRRTVEKNKQESPEKWWKELFDSKYFRSGVGLLSNLSSTAKKMKNVLSKFQDAPAELYSRFGIIQDEVFGTNNGKQAFKDAQLNFVNRIDRYKNLDEDSALQAFGSSVYRLRTFGGRIDDSGTFVWDDSPAANFYYRDDITREIDAELLRDPEAIKAYDVITQYFDEMYDEIIDTLDVKIIREIQGIGDPTIRENLEKIHSSGLTFKEFEKTQAPEGKANFAQMKKGEWGDPEYVDQHKNDISRISSMIEDKARFKRLEGKYVPQKISSVKEAAERKAWEQRNAGRLANVSENNKRILWEEHKASRILEVNKEKWKAFDISEDGLDAIPRYFANPKEAEQGLRVLIDEIPNEGAKARIIDDIRSDQFNIRQYLETEILPDGQRAYRLTTPEKFRKEFPNGLFESLNRDVVTNSNRAFTSLNLTKKADFFDRPRTMEIPLELKELNLQKLIKFYSDDMGVRLNAIRNDMYDRNAVEKYWITPIREEATKRGNIKPQTLQKKLDEVRSWVSVMQNQRPERKVGLSPEEQERIARETANQAKNDNLLNSSAKLVTFPFNYGTTLYSAFTPAVLGPFITSWKSVFQSYKTMFLNKGEFNAFTRELEKMGVIEKKFTAYAQEYQDQYKEELLGDPNSWRRKFADFADNVTEFSANLSLARMVGIDPERLGVGRLMIGSMLDISGAEAGHITMAAFRHIEEMLDATKDIVRRVGVEDWSEVNAKQTFDFRGSQYTKESIERQFENFGITDVEGFIRRSDQFNKTFDYMRGVGDIKNIDKQFYGELAGIANNVVDQYHARTKLSRPLKWLDNVWGRALSRYSVYAQNFGVQTTSKRIYQPLKDWSDRYDMEDENMSFFKVAWWMANKNDAKLKQAFGDQWQQAYDDFPVDAVNNFYKVFGALAAGKAMMMTRAGILDLTGIASNEAVGNDDYEMWRNINKQRNLGSQDNPFTIEDVFSGDVQGFDLMKLFTNTLAGASQLGAFGRLGQVVFDDLKYPQGGIAEMTPVTGLPNEMFERLSNVSQSLIQDPNPKEFFDTTANETIEFFLLRGNPFGTFYDARKPILNIVKNKPKNRNIQFQDSNGQSLDAGYYDF